MPRDIGTGLYHYPDGTPGNDGQTIFSARYNTFINDLSNTLNQALPVNMGGTGSDNVTEARQNLNVAIADVQVTNYDTQIWENGMFWSQTGATGAPNGTDQFTGVSVMMGDNQQNFLSLTVMSVQTGKIYYKRKAITWGAWVLQADDKVDVAGDAMTGDLTISKDAPTLRLITSTSNGPIIYGQFNAIARWAIQFNKDQPTGDFGIIRHNDSGAGIDYPFIIQRASGNVAIAQDLAIGSDGKAQTNFTQSCAVGGVNVGIYNIANVRRWQINADGSSWTHYKGDAGGALTPAFSINNANGAVNIHGTGSLPSAIPSALNIAYNATTTYHGIGIRSGADNGFMISFQSAANVSVGSVNSSSTTTSFNTSSDERLKDDLQPVTTAGQIIDATDVYDFRWKANGERSYGVLAQQANEVYPAAVTHVTETGLDWWGIDYSKYVPVILQELKSVRQRHADALTRIERLEAAILKLTP